VSGFVSFRRDGRAGWGWTDGDRLADLSGRFPTLRAALAAGALPALAGAAGSLRLAEVALDIPVPEAGKILCVGVNYPERAGEYRDAEPPPSFPSLFVRFARSFVGHGAAVLRPRESEQFDYEGEIALVIGRAGRRIAEADAPGHIAGLTLAMDGTLRDWVRHGKFNVTQGKNWDASGAIGPWLVPFAGQHDLVLETRVNGEPRQSDRTSRMLFGFARLVAYISTFTTLEPGDTILTGTPAGAGARSEPPRWLRPGDVVEVAATGLGVLRNRVEDEP
jgi:2-keto-4-pentenoate hydratase/2-oxohepta-3-ene-1,7-dioic acid hydratase in catechol pathway